MREVLDLPEKVQVETQEDELNPQEEMDGEPSVEDLENELATLEAYEIESFVNSSLFADISYEEALEFKFLDSETKAKISQGLIEYWKRKGKKTTQEVKDQKGTSETAKKETMDQLSQTRGEYKAKVSEIRNKINALKGTKASKAQIKTLRNEINALKKEKDLKVNELNSVKALQTMDIKAARTELKRRKEMLKEFIKQVNERVKNDIISADTAKKEITTQISKNAEEIKDFSEAMRSEIKSLREKMKGLKRGSTEYKKLQKQIEDKTQVKNETLKQIREENETLRSERSGIIEEKRQTREDKKEVIEKAKAQFSEKVLEFSEDTKVEARVAKKIIDYLEELAEGNPV